VITVNVVRIPNTHSSGQPTPTTTPTDYLAGEQGEWLLSPPTFFFKKGEYHILNPFPQGIAMAFYAGNDMFTDFSLTVTTSEIIRGPHNGGDYYGIVFRSSTDQLHYYLFEIDPGDGQYGFWRYDGLTPSETLALGDVSDLLPNLGQRNVITAVVKRNTFTFFVNKNRVGTTMTDPLKPLLSSGGIGLSVEEQGTEVAFSDLQIEKLQ
jgi:hypothetical protein